MSPGPDPPDAGAAAAALARHLEAALRPAGGAAAVNEFQALVLGRIASRIDAVFTVAAHLALALERSSRPAAIPPLLRALAIVLAHPDSQGARGPLLARLTPDRLAAVERERASWSRTDLGVEVRRALVLGWPDLLVSPEPPATWSPSAGAGLVWQLALLVGVLGERRLLDLEDGGDRAR